jgi:predicted transcriptional regulator
MNLRTKRQRLRVSQANLARWAGVSVRRISAAENGFLELTPQEQSYVQHALLRAARRFQVVLNGVMEDSPAA